VIVVDASDVGTGVNEAFKVPSVVADVLKCHAYRLVAVVGTADAFDALGSPLPPGVKWCVVPDAGARIVGSLPELPPSMRTPWKSNVVRCLYWHRLGVAALSFDLDEIRPPN
jgi:hypothetical protein